MKPAASSVRFLPCPWCGHVPKRHRLFPDVARIKHTKRCWFAGDEKTFVGERTFRAWNRRHAGSGRRDATAPGGRSC
jgi:hypothetical protein